MKKLALVTIGQAPRVDVTPDVLPVLSEYEVIETGALDELAPAEIAELAPREGEERLVSRLRDAMQAVLSETRLPPHLQRAVDRAVMQGAEAVLIICTGHLEGIEAEVPVYTAETLARGAVQVLIGEGRLGVVVPEREQIDVVRARWSNLLDRDVCMTACDPYTAPLEAFVDAAETLNAQDVDWVFLDCVGYSEQMANTMRPHTGARVLTARNLAARLVAAVV